MRHDGHKPVYILGGYMDNETKIYKVPERNLGTLEERIEKLNKRARKLHMPEVVVTVRLQGLL